MKTRSVWVLALLAAGGLLGYAAARSNVQVNESATAAPANVQAENATVVTAATSTVSANVAAAPQGESATDGRGYATPPDNARESPMKRSWPVGIWALSIATLVWTSFCSAALAADATIRSG